VRWALVPLLLASIARADETLTLEAAMVRARAHHPTVEARRAAVGVAAARVEQALAGFVPALTGGVSYLPQTANYVATPAVARQLTGATGSATVVDSAGLPVVVSCTTPGQGGCGVLAPLPTSWALHDYATIGVGVRWTIWDWGKSIYGTKSARAARASAEADLDGSRGDVVLDVSLAYFGAVASTEQLRVAEETVRAYGEHLAQIEAFHHAGLRTGIDVATARAALANGEIQLSQAHAALRAAQAQLASALGEERWPDFRLEPARTLFAYDVADDPGAAGEGELVDQGLAKRPELRSLVRLAESYRDQQRAARGQYLPRLTLDLGPVWAGPNRGTLIPNFSAIVSLSYPAEGMNPLLVHGQTRQAAAQRTETEAQLRLERLAVRQEVMTARAAWQAGRDTVRAAARLVEAAAKQRELAEGRYKSGVGNVIELYDALLADANARFQAVQAGYALAGARARVRHAIGQP
jgi:outer membrane protein